MSLSIIIPVYEDREACEGVVSRLSEFGEVIVVDASKDDPVSVERLPAGVRLIRSEKALRSHQMNLGAVDAESEWILFLHADTVIPDESFHALEKVLDRPEVVGGGFARRFTSDSLLLRMTCWLADWRGRLWGLFLGDQAIFVRREVFERVGGFHSMSLFEDYDLCWRLAREGRMVCVDPPIASSDRRFRAGVVRTVWKDLLLTLNYFFRGKDAYLEE